MLNLSLLFFFAFLSQVTQQSHIKNQIHPELCNAPDKARFKRFYSQNKTMYDFIVPEAKLDELNCYTKQIKIESKPVTIFYVEIALGADAEDCLLVLSQFDASRPWILEANPKMPDFENTCNQLILDQMGNETEKEERVMSILKRELVSQLKDFFVENYQTKLHSFYIMKIMGIEALRTSIELEFWGDHFKAHNSYLFEHFPNWVQMLADDFKTLIMKYIHTKFDGYITDELGEEVFALVTSQPQFIVEALGEFKAKIRMLLVGAPDEGISASTYMVPSMVATECRIHQPELLNFVNNYHRRIDQRKENDWSMELANDREDSAENLALLATQVELMTADNFHFYILEEFLMFGKKYEARVYKLLNVIMYPVSEWTYVGLTSREKAYFLRFGLENKWLDQRVLEGDQVLQTARVVLNRNNGNEKYYLVEFSPNGSENCVILVKRVYSSAIKYSDELVLDTNEMYWNQRSCLKLTRNLVHGLLSQKYLRRLV